MRCSKTTRDLSAALPAPANLLSSSMASLEAQYGALLRAKVASFARTSKQPLGWLLKGPQATFSQ